MKAPQDLYLLSKAKKFKTNHHFELCWAKNVGSVEDQGCRGPTETSTISILKYLKYIC